MVSRRRQDTPVRDPLTAAIHMRRKISIRILKFPHPSTGRCVAAHDELNNFFRADQSLIKFLQPLEREIVMAPLTFQDWEMLGEARQRRVQVACGRIDQAEVQVGDMEEYHSLSAFQRAV